MFVAERICSFSTSKNSVELMSAKETDAPTLSALESKACEASPARKNQFKMKMSSAAKKVRFVETTCFVNKSSSGNGKDNFSTSSKKSRTLPIMIPPSDDDSSCGENHLLDDDHNPSSHLTEMYDSLTWQMYYR